MHCRIIRFFENERNLQNKKKSTINTIKISILDAINLIVMEKLWQICWTLQINFTIIILFKKSVKSISLIISNIQIYIYRELCSKICRSKYYNKKVFEKLNRKIFCKFYFKFLRYNYLNMANYKLSLECYLWVIVSTLKWALTSSRGNSH